MIVTILGYENFVSKTKHEDITNLYYVREDDIDPARGKGHKVESGFIFGKKLQPEINCEYELVYDVIDFNGQKLAKLTGIKSI